ncbi:MAG: hypothetical protein OEU36_25405, partial [Gammaproteobacteria bacterium]|nr:hypothetical protein [Gammaproteobacteria bacterium]
MPNIQNETEVPGGGDRDMAERLARSLFGMKIDGDLLVTLKDGNDYLYPLESISDDLNAEKISLTTFDENGQAKSSYGICTRMEPDETFDEYLKATFVLRVGHRRTAIWLFDEKLDLNGDGADKFVTLSKMFRVPAEHEAHMVPLFWRAKTGFRRSQSPDDLIKLVRTYWPNGKPELKEKALKAPEGGKPYNYHNVFSFGDADDGEDLLRKTVKLTFGTKISSNDWKTYENEFDDVMPLLLEHNVGTEYGRSFLQGVLVDGANQRSSKNMQENYVLALDIDTGEPLESMRRKIWGDCLFAVIYTRHSHGSTETAVKSEEVRNYFKCNDRTPIDGDIELEHVVEFLRDQKRYWPTILENAKWVAEKDIEGGIHCVISHNPMDKYCVVFVLDKPFVFAEREGDHTEAIQEWKERYARL